ncbi:MAG: hypothetical protein AB7S38_42920 [Vulcanimicrobiota bacterium]
MPSPIQSGYVRPQPLVTARAAGPTPVEQPVEPAEAVELSGGQPGPTTVPKTPLHVLLRVPAAMVGGLNGMTLALVPEAEVKDGRWQSDKPAWTPEVLDMAAPVDQAPGRVPETRISAVTTDSLPENLQSAAGLIFHGPDGWREAGAPEHLSVKSGQDLFLQATLTIPTEQMAAMEGMTVALLQGPNHGLAPEVLSAQSLDHQLAPGTHSVLQTFCVDQTLQASDPEKAWDQAQSRQVVSRKTVDLEGHPVEVELTRGALELLRQTFGPTTGIVFDQGLVATPDPKGTQVHMALGHPTEYTRATGSSAKPYALYCEKAERFGFPNQQLRIEATSEGKLDFVCPEGYRFEGTLTPEPDTPYLAPMGGRDCPVIFNSAACEAIRANGYQFDPKAAVLIDKQGNLSALDGRSPKRLGLEETLRKMASGAPVPPGPDAPAWLFTVYPTVDPVMGHPAHGLQVFVNDQGHLSVGPLGPDGQPLKPHELDDFKGMIPSVAALRSNRDKFMFDIMDELASARSSEPVNREAWPLDTSIPGITISAAGAASLETVREILEGVCGERMRGPRQTLGTDALSFVANCTRDGSPDLSQATSYSEVLESVSADKLREGLARVLGAGPDAPVEELVKSASRARERGKPVEIVVIPKDAEVQAVFDFAQRDGIDASTLRLANFANHPSGKVYLAIGEEFLSDPRGREMVEHEFWHLFESHCATDKELDMLDAAYARTAEAKGPFQSLYGSSRIEFLPTLEEEFSALHGPEGPGWLKQNHPDVYALLQSVTGKNP